MDEYTQIEKLFRDSTRLSQIKYEDFIKAGWTKENYFNYLQQCEIIHAGFVFFDSGFTLQTYCNPYRGKDGQAEIAFKKMERLFLECESLFDWLQQFLSCKIAFTNELFKDLGNSISYSPVDLVWTELASPHSVYVDSDTFRYYIEIAIYNSIKATAPPDNEKKFQYSWIDEINEILGDDIEELFDEEIEDIIDDLEDKKLLQHDQNKGDLDVNFDSYYSIQNYAKTVVRNSDIENEYDNAISLLEEELEARKIRLNVGEQDRLVLEYPPFICSNNEHEIEEVLACIKIMKKGEITQTEINAGYCPHCKAFFVNPKTTSTLLKDDIQILHPLINYDEFRIYTSKRSREST
ncbi:hypothetical protein, partial [Methanobrevibacter sp.]|uniref:hypothetical protein n=1 Tax=Methanobrevibacter sp. TaxID=66852 RepID=UPI0026DF9431